MGSDVTNFPLLIRLDTTNFPEMVTMTEPGGADIRFTDQNSVPLSYEIEDWTDYSSGTVWVLVNTISSGSPTSIRMYYGIPGASSQSNSGAVFSTANGFAGVWHLTPSLSDATSNGYDGTNSGTTDTAGATGRGRHFDVASANAIQIGGLLGQPASVTVSAWVNLTGEDTSGSEAVSLGDVVALRADNVFFGHGPGGTFYVGSSSWRDTPAGADLRSLGWKQFTYVVESGSQGTYVDGVAVSNTAFAGPISYVGLGTDTWIGRHGNGTTDLDFDGDMDEVRVSATVRNADWIKLDYESQRPGSTLVSVAP